jgi:hypothetical protein
VASTVVAAVRLGSHEPSPLAQQLVAHIRALARALPSPALAAGQQPMPA